MASGKAGFISGIAVAGLAALGFYGYQAQRAPSGPVVVGGPSGAGPGGAPGKALPVDAAKKGAGGGAPGGPPGGFAIPVEWARAVSGTVQEDVSALGSLKSNESVVVRPEVGGRIVAIGFTEGAKVSKGINLITLDGSVVAAELQQARANLSLAEANFKRNEDLMDKNFVSAKARDETRSQLDAARANVAVIQARFARTVIKAPFAGTIGIRQVSIGDYVKEAQDLVTLEDLSSLKVDFRLPEALLARVKQGQAVELTVDAFPKERFKAQVVAIDPLLDQAGRSLVIRAKLDNSDGRLRPGLFANVRLILDERANALTVPEDALLPQGQEQFVFRAKEVKLGTEGPGAGKPLEAKVENVKVAIGLRRGGQVEILSGLKVGDIVITAGQLKVRPEATVRLAPLGPPPGAGGPPKADAPKADASKAAPDKALQGTAPEKKAP